MIAEVKVNASTEAKARFNRRINAGVKLGVTARISKGVKEEVHRKVNKGAGEDRVAKASQHSENESWSESDSEQKTRVDTLGENTEVNR